MSVITTLLLLEFSFMRTCPPYPYIASQAPFLHHASPDFLTRHSISYAFSKSINTITIQSFLFFPMFLHMLPHRKYCIRRPSTWHETNLFVPDCCFFPKNNANKIATLGTPHMAEDKAARAYRESTHIVILSLPYPYTKCNLP